MIANIVELSTQKKTTIVKLMSATSHLSQMRLDTKIFFWPIQSILAVRVWTYQMNVR